MLVIGLVFFSNRALACKSNQNIKEKVQLSETIAKDCKKDNFCNSIEGDSGHICDRNCSHNNCVCNTLTQSVFFNEQELVFSSNIYPSIQKKYSFYNCSFYSEVILTIWHPPKF